MKRIRTFLSLLIIVGGIFAAPIQTMAATNINGTPSVASSQSKGDLPSIDQALLPFQVQRLGRIMMIKTASALIQSRLTY